MRFFVPVEQGKKPFLFWDLRRHTNLFDINDLSQKHTYTIRHVNAKYDEDLISVKKPKDTLRILLLGSSSTEGFQIEPDERFSVLLRKLLRCRFPDNHIEVLNAGLSGYTLYQIFIYFQEVLLQLNPDIVILYFGSNSFYYGTVRDRVYYEQLQQMQATGKITPALQQRVLDFGTAGENPALYWFFQSRIVQLAYRFLYKWMLQHDRHPRQQQRTPREDRIAIYEQLAMMAGKHHYSLLLIPEIVWSSEPWDRNYKDYKDEMLGVVRERGIFFLELRSKIYEWGFASQDILIDNLHLSELGNALVAEQLFRFLEPLLTHRFVELSAR